MPVSNFLHLPAVVHYTTSLFPNRILDVGIGLGTYGFMIRQFVDITRGALDKASWTTRIDGVEVFSAYRNPIWDYYYDNVFLGDIRELLPKLDRYDVVLCNDVLEHFELLEAQEIIERLVRSGQTLIATTPNSHFPQGAAFGNEAEEHKCQLKRVDFTDLVAEIPTGLTTCYVCTRRQDHIKILEKLAFATPIYRIRKLQMLISKLRRVAR